MGFSWVIFIVDYWLKNGYSRLISWLKISHNYIPDDTLLKNHQEMWREGKKSIDKMEEKRKKDKKKKDKKKRGKKRVEK